MNNLYIRWSKKHATGIALIDDQHRSIITMINTLVYFMRIKMSNEILKPLTNIIEQYIMLHFSMEETLLRRAGFEDVKSAEAYHGSILNTLRVLLKKMQHTGNPEDLFEFLREWWTEHTEIHDKRYVAHIAAHPYTAQVIEQPAARQTA